MPLVKIAGFDRANARMTNTAVAKTGAGEGFSQLGKITANIATDMANHADGLRAVEAQGEFQRNVDERLNELDPKSGDYMDQVAAIYEEAQGAANENAGLRMAGNKDRFQATLARQSEAGKTAALQMQKTALTKEAVNKFDELAKSAADKIRRMPENADVWLEEISAQIEEFGGVVPPELQEALVEGAEKSAIEAQVEGFAEKGDHKAALAVLDENSEKLTGSERRQLTALQRSIESRQDREIAAENVKQMAAFETDILDATGPKDLMEIRERIDAFGEMGGFDNNPRAKPMLIRQLDATQKQMVKADRTLMTNIAQYESGMGLDSQAATDGVFGEIQKRIIEEGGGPGDIMMAAVDVATRSGFAPSLLTDAMARSERIDQPEQLAAAAQAFDLLNARAPNAVAKVPGNPVRIPLVSSYIKAGMDPQDAAALAIEQTNDKAGHKERIERFNNDFAKTDFREEMEDLGLGDAEAIPASRKAEFAEMTRAFYGFTDDRDAALSAAAERFKMQNRVSDLAGGAVEKNSAESTFPVSSAYTPDDINEVISANVEGIFKEMGMEVPEDFNGKKGWRLVADERTARDIANGNPPTYAVEVINHPAGEAGIYMRQSIITEGGHQVPMRWQQFDNEGLKKTPSYKEKVDKGLISVQRGRMLEEQNQRDSEDPAMLRGFK